MGNYYQGKYTLKNPDKYVGDKNNVIYRSSWELKFLNWCDRNPNVIKFSSEEIVVPYVCPTDKRLHRYFTDAKIVIKDKEGNLKTYLIEIKPSKQTVPPKYPGRKTKRYLTEAMTFMKNQAKWAAAEKYANDRGWKFKILTEKELCV